LIPIKRGSKRPGVTGWRDIRATPELLTKWLGNRYADGGGAGVLAENFPAVDIDILDEAVSLALEEFCHELLGRAPVRIGMPPKRLLAYRTNQPFGKIQSNRFRDPDGREHRVEVLGRGQQWVAYHVHPDTKQPYQWIGDGVADIDPADLPELTEAKARKIGEHFERLAAEAGWKPIDKPRVNSGAQNVADDDAPAIPAPKTDLTPAQVKAVIDEIKHRADDRGDWIAAGMALHHQFDGSDEGLELWDAWSQNSNKHKLRECAAKWRGFSIGGRITFSTPILWAKEARRERKKSGSQGEAKKGFRLIAEDELLAKLGPIDWLVAGLVEADALGVLFGDPNTYKSFVALDLAMCVATGRPYHGRAVTPGRVVYIIGEGHNGLPRRLTAWRQQNRVTGLAAISFSTCAAQFIDTESAKIAAEAVAEIGEPPALVVIDTLARNFGPGDESSNADMGKFIAAVDNALKPYGGRTTVLVVHHTSHGDKKRIRGAMALHAGVDFEYRTERTSGGNRIRVVCSKMKDAAEPGDLHFEARETIIGDFEDNLTSVVLVECEPAAGDTPALTDKQQRFYEIAARAIADHGEEVLIDDTDETAVGVKRTRLRAQLDDAGWFEAHLNAHLKDNHKRSAVQKTLKSLKILKILNFNRESVWLPPVGAPSDES